MVDNFNFVGDEMVADTLFYVQGVCIVTYLIQLQ